VRIWPPAVLRAHAERRAELDARAAAANGEKDLSRERLETMCRDVAGPIQEFGRRNQFADLIRKSLLEGYKR
jgi:hypothetical protein